MNLESFANYQDVKTKTINWCNKMKNSGLLTSDQFDECVSTFKDVKTGILPKKFKIPKTGVSRNYSLYNTQIQDITPNLSGDNTNTVLLLNNMGYYMGCSSNDSIYFVKDINDSTINQQEIYFTLIPQNETVYSILSSYGKYLIANSGPNNINDSTIPTGQSSRQDWCSSFTGKNIGPMTNWNIKKYESENNNDRISKVTFESVQISNFFLSSVQNSQDNTLQIVYGSDDSTMWQIIPKESNIINSTNSDDSIEYIVTKDNILTNLALVKSEIIYIKSFKDSLSNLQNLIRNNYANIINYVNQLIDNQTSNITTSNPIDKTFTNKNNINISNNEKIDLINNIKNTKNSYIQQIEGDISKINILLNNLNKKNSEIDSEYQNFLKSLSSKLLDVKTRLKINNEIINRQQNNSDKLNIDYAYIDNKKEKSKKIDEIAKLNIDLISNYSNNNSFLVKIYPLIIFIIFIFITYLIYITYNKFMINIYHEY